MSDDIDDFLAGLDSLSSTSFLAAATPATQQLPPVLTADNLRATGKKRGRPSSSQVTPMTATPSATQQVVDVPSQLVATDEWVCPVCTLKNDIIDKACVACESPRVAAQEPQGQWTCPICTCLNSLENDSCQACMCERDQSINVVCKCGCVNRGGAANCKRCNSSIENAKMAYRTIESLKKNSSAKIVSADPQQPSSPVGTSASQTPVTSGPPAVSTSGLAPVDDTNDDPEVGSESSESDYGSDSDDDVGAEGRDAVLTTGQVTNFMHAIPSVNTENITPAQVPRSMTHCGLKDFQLQAIAWMVDREKLMINNQPMFSMVCKGGLLADYMGLGKTRTIIGLCEAAKSVRRDRMVSDRVDSAATLIVCPVSVMSQWRDEIKRTVRPCPRVLIYYGTNRKNTIFQVAQEYDYVISSYHSLAYEYDYSPTKKIFRIQWHRVVLDEAHWIRNRTTHIAKACSYLNGMRRWVVTATPIQNRLSDLEPLIAFLKLPGFSEHSWWRSDMDDQMIRCLQAILSTIMLRRTPDTVINGKRILDLPPKEIVTIEEKLPAEEQHFMKDLKNRVSLRLNEAQAQHDAFRTYAHAFEMLVRCRQACLHRNIVIESLRAKMGLSGTSEGALEALEKHKQAHERRQEQENDTAAKEELARLQAELKQEEAKLKVERATEAQLADFLKLLKKKLVSSEFGATVIESINNKSAFEAECIVCLEPMTIPSILPCAHMYCRECIKTCLEATNRCPLCKVKVTMAKVINVPHAIHGKGDAAPASPSSPTSEADALLLANRQKSRRENKKAAQADEQAFLRWLSVDPGPVTTWQESDRTRRIRELVQETGEDDRVLVLSSFVTYLRSLEAHLNRAGISTAVMDGSMNPTIRQAVIGRFTQETGGPKVLLASIGTCGVGLNLTRASLCILAEPNWNPGVEEQAVNRIHRLGQTKPVRIVRFSAKDSVEEAMSEICDQKRRLGERLTNSRLSRDDIIAVLQRFALADAPPTQGPTQ